MGTLYFQDFCLASKYAAHLVKLLEKDVTIKKHGEEFVIAVKWGLRGKETIPDFISSPICPFCGNPYRRYYIDEYNLDEYAPTPCFCDIKKHDGLFWKQLNKQTLTEAISIVSGLKVGGYDNWKLPTRDQLVSKLGRSEDSLAYWTSSHKAYFSGDKSTLQVPHDYTAYTFAVHNITL